MFSFKTPLNIILNGLFTKSTLRIDNSLFLLALIIGLCWTLNYLLVDGFGLYHDDWPAMADFTKRRLWGVDSAFDWLHKWPHGRPLGWFLLSTLGLPARQTGNLFYLYIVGFFIVCTISILIFFVVRKKFGDLAGLLSAFFFLVSPADTTQIQVTMNYIAHTGIIFSLLATWFYQNQKRIVAYFFAAMALLCYESSFFIFLAAPLLSYRFSVSNTVRKLLSHGLICVLLIAIIIMVRLWIFDSGFVIHSNQQQKEVIQSVLGGLISYSKHFFVMFGWGIEQGVKNITIFSGLVAVIVSVLMTYVAFQLNSKQSVINIKACIELCLVGFALLFLGLITSGLADYYPHMAYGGRNTRVFVSATWGGAIVITAIALFLLTLNKFRKISYCIFFGVSFALSLNALKIQNDYRVAWDLGKQVFRSSLDLSCDAELGDTIIVYPQNPFWDRGRAIYPYGFGYSTAIADTFNWENTPLEQIPTIMKANKKDWYQYLELKDDGKLHWKTQVLSGFAKLARAPIEPESVIYLKGNKRGLIRLDEPIIVDGVNIIKPAAVPRSDCIFKNKELSGPLAGFLFPESKAFR